MNKGSIKKKVIFICLSSGALKACGMNKSGGSKNQSHGAVHCFELSSLLVFFFFFLQWIVGP